MTRDDIGDYILAPSWP